MEHCFTITANHNELPLVFIVTILIMMMAFSINMYVITSSLEFKQRFQQ